MNTARNGRSTRNSTHSVFSTPDTEWSRNRSVKTWNKTMSQMNRKKNHSTDQKMSPNETSATITVSSLSRWAERNKHCGRGGDTPQASNGQSCGPPIPHDKGRCAAPVHDQPAEATRWATRPAAMPAPQNLTV